MRTDAGIRLSDGKRLWMEGLDALREVVRSTVGSGTSNLTADGVHTARSLHVRRETCAT